MYEFTNSWFRNTARFNWDNLVPQINPTRILEIGSYEGAATCYLIERLGNVKELDITCIDTWEGSNEHKRMSVDMGEVEARFDANINYACNKVTFKPKITKIKGFSDIELMKMSLGDKRDYFDFIYVDGSHATFDVLTDGVLAFKLLKIDGVLVFDDYNWAAPGMKNMDDYPKLAIDAFTTCLSNKIVLIQTINSQIFVQRIV